MSAAASLTITQIAHKISSGEQSVRKTIELALARAEAVHDHNVFLSMTAERALLRADEIDAKIEAGESVGVLAGIPFAAKDNFLTFGSTTTAASHMLETFESPVQAEAVERLEAGGAICIGKLNLDAFAHGGSTENSAFGPTKNAIDRTRVAGGSSGGSAVAVALGVVPFTLGSDTGGSIRQPASFNGVYGIKPTYGCISRYGVVAMASSTDCVGAFASSAADLETVMAVMAGQDDKDMTSLPDYFIPQKQQTSNNLVRNKKRAAVITELMTDDVDPAVVQVVRQYVKRLTSIGYVVDEVSLPMIQESLAMYYVIVSAEISSNLARYDTIRYGHRPEAIKTLAELYGNSRELGFETENKRRIIIGSYVLSSGFFDAYYQQAQKARTLLIDSYNKIFESYDVLISPVSPTPAFTLGEISNDPIKMYLADAMTVGPSLAGLTALSVPAGENAEGLPIGVQLVGAQRSDAYLLTLARQCEEQYESIK